jgi:hypothetical protein
VASADGGLRVTGGPAERVGALAFEAGIPLFELRGEETSLEDVFLRMTDATTKEVAR